MHYFSPRKKMNTADIFNPREQPRLEKKFHRAHSSCLFLVEITHEIFLIKILIPSILPSHVWHKITTLVSLAISEIATFIEIKC